MLFNSYFFIFFYLPICFLGYGLLQKFSNRTAVILWLIVCSLWFYGYWNPRCLLLIGASVLFNYFIARVMMITSKRGLKKTLLVIGISGNLMVLCYFKYMGLFAQTIEGLLNFNFSLSQVILPLGISFYTFEQIAFLVDTWRTEVGRYSFLEYCLFVTFFPRLIAGPIVRHDEFLPQVHKAGAFKLNLENISVGFSIFFLGLFKKVFFADNVASIANPVFNLADAGHSMAAGQAWAGLLAYSLQIYFDFSSYSDMAIGLARIFGITLPMNFNSPYKAINVSDFWTRWNISLSRFLRDYLYIPLGGNRKGKIRQYINVMVTMLLGGLWHGASWAFVLWGGLHGIYLMIHHLWTFMCSKYALPKMYFGKILARAITFLVVAITWVPFRAKSMMGVKTLYYSMIHSTPSTFHQNHLLELIGLLGIVFFAPNLMQIFKGMNPVLEPERLKSVPMSILNWSPSVAWGVLIAGIASVAFYYLGHAQAFIYFDF